ncbi:hypothetical protein HKBW3S06_00854, partial [Candidatus Hakubella thermalkaliphila]
LNWRFRKGWDQNDVITKWNEFYTAVISTVEDTKNSRIIKPIQEKIKALGGYDFSDLELSLLELEQPFSKSFFSKRSSTNQIEQKRLGSGISILLSYFLLETISKLSKEQINFLIDEPELHLHPQLQQKLLKEFQESEFQVVYATQSDCLIDISRWKCITGVPAKRAKFQYLAQSSESKSDGKLTQNLVFAVPPILDFLLILQLHLILKISAASLRVKLLVRI